ncbi:MAG: hypothetical protein ACJ8ER_05130 [Allosphingosinicella sp.]
MSIFVVVQQNPSGPSGTLANALTGSAMPNYKLADGVWLVSSAGTAKDISEKIGIAEGANGTGVVTEVASYFGRANPAIWSWIKQNWEGNAVG